MSIINLKSNKLLFRKNFNFISNVLNEILYDRIFKNDELLELLDKVSIKIKSLSLYKSYNNLYNRFLFNNDVIYNQSIFSDESIKTYNLLTSNYKNIDLQSLDHNNRILIWLTSAYFGNKNYDFTEELNVENINIIEPLIHGILNYYEFCCFIEKIVDNIFIPNKSKTHINILKSVIFQSHIQNDNIEAIINYKFSMFIREDNMVNPDYLYCIWYPKIAKESTYKLLFNKIKKECLYPHEYYLLILRSCFIGKYYDFCNYIIDNYDGYINRTLITELIDSLDDTNIEYAKKLKDRLLEISEYDNLEDNMYDYHGKISEKSIGENNIQFNDAVVLSKLNNKEYEFCSKYYYQLSYNDHTINNIEDEYNYPFDIQKKNYGLLKDRNFSFDILLIKMFIIENKDDIIKGILF